MDRIKNILLEILPIIFALLLTMLVSSILILIYGENPAKVYKVMLEGTIGNWYGIGQVLFKSTPLIFAGLSVSFAFRAGLFNIGAEGQLYFGAFITALVGFSLPEGTPSIIAIPLCILGGFLGGAIIGSIPGFLKAKFGSHEVINTIMLNFISIAFVNYLVSNFFHLPETLHTESIIKTAYISRMSEFISVFKGSSLNLVFIIALLTCILIYHILWRTKFGYEVRAVGYNIWASEFGGISVKKIIIISMIISGGLSGLVGLNYVLGFKYYFEEGFSSGIGFMGIAVALLGRNNPFGIILAALLFGFLSQGGLVINAIVPKELVDVLQAVVILFLISSTNEVRRLVWRK